MKTLYLLFNGNYNVLWNTDKKPLEQLLEDYPDYFIPDRVLVSEVENECMVKLEQTTGLYVFEDSHKPVVVPEEYYQKKLQIWYGDFPSSQAQRKLGYGVWALFDKAGVAQYSFTRYRVKNIYKHDPTHFIMPPVWLGLTLEEMLKLYTQYEWKVIEEEKHLT